jgi:hypothetical protein
MGYRRSLGTRGLRIQRGLAWLLAFLLCGCMERSGEVSPAPEGPASARADLVSVEALGGPRFYRLKVTISSPDTGCNQYANWWEVVSADGDLLYRRILRHSHVDEQPFARIGGPLELQPDQVVWIRAHMHPGGYGGKAARGSIASGFVVAELNRDFAAEVAEQPPLPEGCAY